MSWAKYLNFIHQLLIKEIEFVPDFLLYFFFFVFQNHAAPYPPMLVIDVERVAILVFLCNEKEHICDLLVFAYSLPSPKTWEVEKPKLDDSSGNPFLLWNKRNIIR